MGGVLVRIPKLGLSFISSLNTAGGRQYGLLRGGWGVEWVRYED